MATLTRRLDNLEAAIDGRNLRPADAVGAALAQLTKAERRHLIDALTARLRVVVGERAEYTPEQATALERWAELGGPAAVRDTPWPPVGDNSRLVAFFEELYRTGSADNGIDTES